MNWVRRHFPFNAEQTVNILGEFGPLMAMFIINFAYGIKAGVWALIVTTVISMVVMYSVLRRLPVFPFIAGTVTIGCGVATLVTGDPIWVQIKVTIFNVAFAAFLWAGLYTGRNFFKYILHKTFHYTDEGWRHFTHNFALFFILTAVSNELVRVFMSLEAWILFKMFIVMPAAGLFAWWQTRLMHKFRIEPPRADAVAVAPAQESAAAVSSIASPVTAQRADSFEYRRVDSLVRKGKVGGPTRNPV